MAIRKRDGRAKPWQVYWNNPFTGKRETISFETKEEAEKEDSLVKHRLKFERESFQNERSEEKQKSLTLEAAYILYLEEKQFNKKGLAWQMDSMRMPLARFGSKELTKISKEDLQAYQDDYAQRNVKAVTVRNRMAVLRAVLRWAAEKGFCTMPQMPKLPRGVFAQFIPPSREEMLAMLEVAPSHIARVIIIGSQTGARIGGCELFGLKWEDVDMTRKIIRIHGSRKNPSMPWREVPLRDSLVPILAKWQNEDECAGIEYLIHFRGQPVSTIRTAWSNTLKAAHITRHIRPYDLRHAFATELLAAGVDVGTVAKLMGHSSPSMVLSHYQYVMDKQKRAAVESLPDLSHVPNPMCPKKEGATNFSVTP